MKMGYQHDAERPAEKKILFSGLVNRPGQKTTVEIDDDKLTADQFAEKYNLRSKDNSRVGNFRRLDPIAVRNEAAKKKHQALTAEIQRLHDSSVAAIRQADVTRKTALLTLPYTGEHRRLIDSYCEMEEQWHKQLSDSEKQTLAKIAMDAVLAQFQADGVPALTFDEATLIKAFCDANGIYALDELGTGISTAFFILRHEGVIRSGGTFDPVAPVVPALQLEETMESQIQRVMAETPNPYVKYDDPSRPSEKLSNARHDQFEVSNRNDAIDKLERSHIRSMNDFTQSNVMNQAIASLNFPSRYVFDDRARTQIVTYFNGMKPRKQWTVDTVKYVIFALFGKVFENDDPQALEPGKFWTSTEIRSYMMHSGSEHLTAAEFAKVFADGCIPGLNGGGVNTVSNAPYGR
jgi:hypothetical protein